MKAFWILVAWVATGVVAIWSIHAASVAGGSADPHRGDAHVSGSKGTSHGGEGGQHPGSSSSGEPHHADVSTIPVGHDVDPARQIVEPQRKNREAVLHEQGLFPCSDCHNLLIPNPSKRERFAKPHDQIELIHGDAMACTTCHDENRRDSLRRIDGERFSFNESHRVCGGCHGPIYRDWLNGAHGQRTGHWNGEKDVWVCVRCHHPHRPEFPPMRPLAPPRTRFQSSQQH